MYHCQRDKQLMLQYNQTICKKGSAVDAASRGDKPTPAQTIFQTYLSGLCRESSLSCRGPRIGSGGPRWAPLAVSSWGPLGVQSFRVPCGATNGNPQWHGWHTRLALATGAARLINKDAEGRALHSMSKGCRERNLGVVFDSALEDAKLARKRIS